MSETTKPSLPHIGFIGLGGMGRRMALRLLAAGYVVTGYDRARTHEVDLERFGASIAASPRELAAAADVVMSSVTDDAAVEDVMYGPQGVLAGARPRTVIIDVSTVLPDTSLQLFQSGRARSIDVLDAPVSGSLPQAEQGQLVVFVGGERPVFDRCRPILGVLGKASFYMGPSGSGSTTKLCTNTLLGLGLQALAEAVALGERAGLPRDRLLDALSETSVVSPSQRSKFDNIKRDEYPATFPQRLMFKDFALVLREALALSVPVPATAAAAQVAASEHARETVEAVDEDFSAVVRAMEESALPQQERSHRR